MNRKIFLVLGTWALAFSGANPAEAQLIFKSGFEPPLPITQESCQQRVAVPIDCGVLDFDGDGLPDCYEESIGTSRLFADSDGDEINDFDEIFKYFFNSETNPYRFNPRIADVPLLNIEISEVPKIAIRYTTSEGSEETISSEDSVTNSMDFSSSSTLGVSVGMEVSQTAGGEFGTSGASASYESSVSASWEASASLTTESSQGYSETYSRAQAATQQEGVTNTGGELLVTLTLKNAGNLAITIEDIVLSAGEIDLYPFLADPDGTPYFSPIGNLTLDGFGGDFPDLDLAPGEMTAQLTFSNRDLSLADTLALLEDSRNLQIKTSITSISDPAASDLGRSFTSAFNTIFGATAQVIIDYGEDRGYDKYYVSTLGDGSNEISLVDALCDVLQMDVGSNQQALGELGKSFPQPLSVAANPDFGRQWQIVTFSSSQGGTTTLYDPGEGYNLDSISLRAGQAVQLTLIEDIDGDGLYGRQESIFGSDPNPDSDGDGLTDGFETLEGWVASYPDEGNYEVFSSPINSDQDNDGFSDPEELANGTDPNRPDFNPDPKKRTPADYNADGLTDLLIGASGTDVSLFNGAGSAYVHQVYGGGQVIAVTPINQGSGSQNDDLFGFTSTSGYYNEDAYADAVISVVLKEADGVVNAGAVQVVFGSPIGLDYSTAITLTEVSVRPSPTYTPTTDDHFGRRLTTGDFNGDGFDDFAIGAPLDNLGGVDAGRVFVMMGGNGFESDPGTALVLESSAVETGDFFGDALSSGDFNGDGFDDLLVGATRESVTVADQGDVLLFHGTASGLQTSATRFRQKMWAGQVEEVNDLFGERLAVADFNQDGYDDAVISAPGEDGNDGAAYLALGSPTGLAALSPASGGLLLQRPSTRYGAGLATGDFNDDGCPDLAIGEENNNVYIYYNTPQCETEPILAFNPAKLTHAFVEAADQDMISASAGEKFGAILSSGDFNNDGVKDLLIGAHEKDIRFDINDDQSSYVDRVGRAYLLFGQKNIGLTVDNEQSYKVLDHPDVADGKLDIGGRYYFGLGPQ